MAQSLRAGSRVLARMSSRSFQAPRRSFAISSVVRAPDLIQDLYLKELKAYKPPPQKASDAEGYVQKFTPPAAPKSPEEANLASELKAYDESVVEVEGQSSSGETQTEVEDLFEEPEPDDVPHH
ncbi:hypothetical protein B0A52_07468 [Exophiala mesophila]|uniref:ATP synthase subunit H, mitochondrial n=1 Tax=Exophiala mesophila TaxID=212818 RepID=A0A438MYJ2_EXOME|nr:hypothetical protein B0A52_07468 [Exophiala mesophila]